MEVLLALTSLVNLVCLIVVFIKMLADGGLMKALFGLLCCQIYVFFWGWTELEGGLRKKVMIPWTVAILAQIVIGVMHPELFTDR